MERYFRHEGRYGDGVSAIPIETSNLRLYCIRLNDKILIFGSGGIKDCQTWEESETLAEYVETLVTYLFPKGKYDFINEAIRSLPENKAISTKKDIEYLNRYSNNLITVSPLQTIDLEPNKDNKEWLFHNYVH